MDVVEVSTARIRWLAWALTAFAMPLIYGAHQAWGWEAMPPIVFVFGALILLLFLYSASIRISEERLDVSYPFGAYAISWSEVDGFSEGGGNLKLVGAGKSLTLPGFEFWHGSARSDAIDFFNRHLSSVGAKQLPGYTALLPTFTGTRKH